MVWGTEKDPTVVAKTCEQEPGVTRIELTALGTSPLVPRTRNLRRVRGTWSLRFTPQYAELPQGNPPRTWEPAS